MNLKEFLQGSGIILERNDDDEIQVKGIGMYTYGSLKDKVQKMAKEMAKWAKRGDFKKAGRNGIRAYAEMWHALDEYERSR